jgi:hypothetical protein
MVRRVSLDTYHPLDGGDNSTGAVVGGEDERMGVMKETKSYLFDMEKMFREEGPQGIKARHMKANRLGAVEKNTPLMVMIAEQIASPDKINAFAQCLQRLGMTVKDNKGGRGVNSFFIELAV